MLYQILLHTPVWVWGLFTFLLWMGWKQSRPGSVGLARTTVTSLAMAGLSLYGTVSVFGAAPLVLGGWCISALPLAWTLSRTALPAGTRYDAGQRRFMLAGSWVPLALMMGIFLAKYAIGVVIAMEPAHAHEPVFALAAALLYGAFSGCFIGRSGRLWRLARDSARPALAGLAT